MFLTVPFPSTDEGIQEKEKPLEKPELNSSPGKGEDKEIKPGKEKGGFCERSGVKCPGGQVSRARQVCGTEAGVCRVLARAAVSTCSS